MTQIRWRNFVAGANHNLNYIWTKPSLRGKADVFHAGFVVR